MLAAPPRVRDLLRVLASCLALSTVACDDNGAPKNTLNGWPPGEPVVAGNCEFYLKKATFYHSNEFHLDVEILGTNTGTKKVYCGFAARVMTSSDTELTDAAKGGADVPPEEERTWEAHGREANVTGISTGPAEGAWVYVKLSEGHWPMDTSVAVYANPERIRPPD